MKIKTATALLLIVWGFHCSAWSYSGDVFTGDDNYIYRQRHLEETETETVFSPLNPRVSLTAAGTVVYWIDRWDKTIYRLDTQGNAVPEPVLVTLTTPYMLKIDPAAQKLYWFEEPTIMRANVDGTGVEPIITIEGFIQDFAISPDAEKVFWLDLMTESIMSANMDGSNVQNITPSGLPEFDPSTAGMSSLAASRDHLYFSCGAYVLGRSIYRIPLNGGTLETVHNSQGFIVGLFFHEAEDTLYWAFGPNMYGSLEIQNAFGPYTGVADVQIDEDFRFCLSWGEDRPILWWADAYGIRKKSLSYVKRLTAVTNPLTSMKSDFTDEATGGWIYWAEMEGYSSYYTAGAIPGTGAIYRVTADGTQRETVKSGLNSVSAILVDPVHGHLYWVDFLSGTINRATLGSQNTETIVENAGLALDLVYDSGSNTLYWSDYSSGIWSFNLTTLSRNPVKSMSNVESPLALDTATQTLYFVNANFSLANIKTDGSNEEHMSVHYGGYDTSIIYDANGSSLYWLTGDLVRLRLGAPAMNEYMGKIRGKWLALDVRPPTITIIGRPTAYVGTSVTLRTGVLPPLSGQVYYEWYKDDGLIEDADTPSLLLNSLTLEDAGVYHLVIRDESKGQYTSSPFVLTVLEGELPAGRTAVLGTFLVILAAFAILHAAKRTFRQDEHGAS